MALMTVNDEDTGDFRSKARWWRARSWTWCFGSCGAEARRAQPAGGHRSPSDRGLA